MSASIVRSLYTISRQAVWAVEAVLKMSQIGFFAATAAIAGRRRRVYLLPITIECGPTSGTTRAAAKPASRIQPMQSAPV